MDFILSYNNREGVMVFPVVPNEAIVLQRTQKNETFDSVSGEMQALGTLRLAAFELASFFPTHDYPFIRPGGKRPAWDFVRTIEAVRARRIPFRAVHLDNSGREIFNLPVSVDSFEYWIDQAGDISYKLSFREYRFAEAPLSSTLPAQKEPEGRLPTTAPAPLTAPLTDSQAAVYDNLPDGGSMTMRSGAVVSSGHTIDVPPSVNQGGVSGNYTEYARFNWKYNQGEVFRAWKAKGSQYTGGIATINGCYLVAMTTKFGQVGDGLKIFLEDGTVIPAIIGDSKGKNPGVNPHPGESGSEWGHYLSYGGRGKLIDIIEWEAVKGGPRSYVSQSGWLNKKVVRVINYGSWLNQ